MMTSEKSAPLVATCAGPGCQAPLTGQQARFCSERCRKAAHRDRGRAERQAPERQKAATPSRRSRPNPERVTTDAEEYARALAAEAERSLRQDPSRWRWVRAADPDHHRTRPRRQPWRAES